MKKRKLAARRKAKTRHRYFLGIGLSMFLLLGLFLLWPMEKSTWQSTGALSHYISPIKNWFAERKNHLRQRLVKAKQPTAPKPTAEPEVHFEFYTALPKMQVTIPSPQQEEKSSTAVLANPSKREKSNDAKVKSVFDAEELAQDFSKHLAQKEAKSP